MITTKINTKRKKQNKTKQKKNVVKVNLYILWANSADNNFVIFFLCQKFGFDISCNLFPLEVICMKCKSRFPGKKIRKIFQYVAC